jgi:sporulation protein YlmC with PRC-barrel domain
MNIERARTAVAIALGAASVVLAQPREPASPPPDRTARAAPELTLAQALQSADARVSKLVGTRVAGLNGEDLGEVEDVLATAENDAPIVVVSVGGVLDVGDKWYATSLDELIVAGGDELMLDRTEDQLANEPPFDYIPRAGEKSHIPGVTGPGTKTSLDSLQGASVVDERGQSIGEIDDFVVTNREHGTRAIIKLNEAAGRGADGRLVAIPFDELRIDASGEETKGVPPQPRVEVNLEDTPIEALPAYQYGRRDVV